MQYAVWYHAAGCLPDSDEPEFIGTEDECIEWVDENATQYERPDVTHDTYGLSIDIL